MFGSTTNPKSHWNMLTSSAEVAADYDVSGQTRGAQYQLQSESMAFHSEDEEAVRRVQSQGRAKTSPFGSTFQVQQERSL